VRILLVEDSDRIAQTASAALRARGNIVEHAATLQEAGERIEAHEIDVAIVDLGMPDGSGLDWCRAMRKAGSQIPILILTARTAVPDRIEGLDAGADNYLGKPFAIEELLARVRALGRRGPHWTESSRRFGVLEIDRDRRTLSVEGEMVALTPREFEIAAHLAWREGRVVARDELVESVWGESSDGASASFEVLLARVRRKLAERGVRDAIRTVRQVGYAWTLRASKRG
jgi:two-component system OmpR family response regulator